MDFHLRTAELFLVRAWFFIALWVLAFATDAVVSAQTASSVATISSVEVSGNKNVSSLLIYGQIQEKAGDVFSPRKLRDDIKAVFSMGDFKNVKVDAEPGPQPNQLHLTFIVEERPQVSAVLFKGNKKWGLSKFTDEIKTAVKKPYDPSLVAGDVDIIRNLYLDEGYSNVGVTATTTEDAQAGTVQVTFDIYEGLQIKVGGVTVIGTQAFSSAKVADQMTTNKSGSKYKSDALDDDMKAIEDFYHDQGYLRAAVLNHQETYNPVKHRIYITLTVREGPQYTTGDITFQGNFLFTDQQLLQNFDFHKGDILKQDHLDDATKKIKSLYADKGYIYSTINPVKTYDEDLKKVDIAYNIIEGQVAYVQDIKIVGNYKTQDYVIRRELSIKAGDKFEADKIRASCEDLYNLGYFDEVNPTVEPGDEPGKEILVFNIKERKTGSISVGGGYSSVNGLVGDIKLEEANLFGKGQHVNLDVEFGALRDSVDVGFTEPWLFNTPTSFSVNLFDTTSIYTTSVANPDGTDNFYTEVNIGGSISLGRRLSRFWSIFGAYSLQNVQISNVDSYYSMPGTPQYIQATDSTTSSFTPRIVYDSRDNVFDPTTGWKHQLSIEFAGGPFGAQNNFIKTIEDSSAFLSLPADFVLGQHVRLGAAAGYWFMGRGYTDVPLYEKFFAGGTDTIRGYNERSVGPVNGGNALFVTNTELKHTIVGPLKGVLFFDSGNSWDSLWDVALGQSHVQFGAGIGVRLTIPGTIMALRLDYGWPIHSDLPAAAAPPGGVLHFNLGDIF